MAKKKAPTKAEKDHMGKVAALGCIIKGCNQPAQVHHLTGAGMGMRASHFDTIPLCMYHHLTGPFGHAVHNGTKTFEKNYGTQRELLEQTREKLKQREEQSC